MYWLRSLNQSQRIWRSGALLLALVELMQMLALSVDSDITRQFTTDPYHSRTQSAIFLLFLISVPISLVYVLTYHGSFLSVIGTQLSCSTLFPFITQSFVLIIFHQFSETFGENAKTDFFSGPIVGFACLIMIFFGYLLISLIYDLGYQRSIINGRIFKEEGYSGKISLINRSEFSLYMELQAYCAKALLFSIFPLLRHSTGDTHAGIGEILGPASIILSILLFANIAFNFAAYQAPWFALFRLMAQSIFMWTTFCAFVFPNRIVLGSGSVIIALITYLNTRIFMREIHTNDDIVSPSQKQFSKISQRKRSVLTLIFTLLCTSALINLKPQAVHTKPSDTNLPEFTKPTGALKLIASKEKSNFCPRYNRYSGLKNHPAIALITFNRPHQLNQTLYELLCLAGADSKQVFLISDADDQKVVDMTEAIAAFYGVPAIFNRNRGPDGEPRPKRDGITVKITDHYIFIFKFTFGKPEKGIWEGKEFPKSFAAIREDRSVPNHVIILEDDLSVGDDFVTYFSSLAEAMSKDSSIFCASAWYDNGYPAAASSLSTVRRGQHFMALGWMFSRQHFLHYIEPGWTNGQESGDWDLLFIKAMDRYQRLECIYPEVPRTHHRRGEQGSAYTTKNWWQVDRFDNMKLSHKDVELNLKNIRRTSYEDYLQIFVQEAVLVKELDHIKRFHMKKLLYVCDKCGEDHEKWNEVMETYFKVFGVGYDRRVRGEHYHSVFVRYATNQVLLISPKFYYYEKLVKEKRDIEAVIPDAIAPIPNDPIPAVISDKEKPKLVISETGEMDCAKVCARSKRFCSEQYLTYINDCEYMKAAFGCEISCESGDLHAPSVSWKDGEPEEGKFDQYQFCAVTVARRLRCQDEESLGQWRNSEILISYDKKDSKHKTDQRICICITKEQYDAIHQ